MESKKEKQTDNWAEMSDGQEEQEAQETAEGEQKNHVIKPAKKKAPEGSKNKYGDYVVTSIDIPDLRTGVKDNEKGGVKEDSSDSDTEYDDEDDNNEQQAAEETKVEGK